MGKQFPSSKSGQSNKVNSHEQAMAWSKKHVAANNTKSTGSQTGTKMTPMKSPGVKPGAAPGSSMPQGW